MVSIKFHCGNEGESKISKMTAAIFRAGDGNEYNVGVRSGED